MYFKSLNFEEYKTLNERVIDNKKKKNCLPIALDVQYNEGRIMCANTHYLTGFKQALQSSGVRTGLLLAVCGLLFYGGLGAIPGLLYFLKSFYGSTIQPLIRQHNARDFLLFPSKLDKNANQEEILRVYNKFNEHPVLAINDGKVVKIIQGIPNDSHRGDAEGNCIIIEHDNGAFFSLYAHLYDGSIIVSENETVKKGQRIAGVGNTGNSEAPHLHFEITYLHPDKYFSWGKEMINFEPYMCAHINIMKELINIIKNKDTALDDISNKKLTKNTSGELDNLCFLT